MASTQSSETGAGRFRSIASQAKQTNPFAALGGVADGIQYGPHDKVVSQPARTAPTSGFDMQALVQALLGAAQQQQGADLGFKRDLAFGRHLGIDGQPIDPETANPWGANGVFKGGFGGKAAPNSPGPNAHSWDVAWTTPKGPINGGNMPNMNHLGDPAASDQWVKNNIGTMMPDGQRWSQGNPFAPGKFGAQVGAPNNGISNVAAGPYVPSISAPQPWKPGPHDFAENMGAGVQADLPGKRQLMTGSSPTYFQDPGPASIYPDRNWNKPAPSRPGNFSLPQRRSIFG